VLGIVIGLALVGIEPMLEVILLIGFAFGVSVLFAHWYKRHGRRRR
jgi:hypothetical protein